MKKVICIKEFNKDFGKEITVGKTYEVITETKEQYRIENDNGYKCDYYKFRFKLVSV